MSLGAVSLSCARRLISCLAAEESVLLISSPGVGKSDIVHQAAREAGLAVRSLLGTQIAPEDVSGVPRVVGLRSVFCPPRVLLPEDRKPFCLFLDELPAAPAEVQKAFYSLLLERRIGEHLLPPGTWVIAAGNTSEDRAHVRAVPSTLINRVFLLPIRVDVSEWLIWAEGNGVRLDVRYFIQSMPEALQRPAPRDPAPFSTPRSWTQLSTDLNLAERAGTLTMDEHRALVFGRVSAQDAALFCAVCENRLSDMCSLEEYLQDPTRLPESDVAQWLVVSRLRQAVRDGRLAALVQQTRGQNLPSRVNDLLAALPEELRFAALLDLVPEWANLGATAAMLRSLKEVTGL